MSQPFAVRRPSKRPALHRLLLAQVAVGVAHALIRLSPRRLSAAMRMLSRGASPADIEQARRSREVIVAASLRCARHEGCLPRSVATTLYCRLNGRWPTWCVGVRTYPPFGAHAWVQVDDEIVGEDLPPSYFQPLITVGPHRRDASGRRPEMSTSTTHGAAAALARGKVG